MSARSVAAASTGFPQRRNSSASSPGSRRVSKVKRTWRPAQGPRSTSRSNQRFRCERSSRSLNSVSCRSSLRIVSSNSTGERKRGFVSVAAAIANRKTASSGTSTANERGEKLGGNRDKRVSSRSVTRPATAPASRKEGSACRSNVSGELSTCSTKTNGFPVMGTLESGAQAPRQRGRSQIRRRGGYGTFRDHTRHAPVVESVARESDHVRQSSTMGWSVTFVKRSPSGRACRPGDGRVTGG